MSLPYFQPSRKLVFALVGLALASAGGCSSQAIYIGTWTTDQAAYQNTPSGKSPLRKFLSPELKFSVQFAENGTCTVKWTEGGKEGSRVGTWKQVEGDGLRFVLLLKLPPDEEEWRVKVTSRSNRRLALEALDEFQSGGGAMEFKRG